jgi:hypothetical protein
MRLAITLCITLLLSITGFAQVDLKPLSVFPVDYLPVGTHVFDVMVQNVGNVTNTWGGFKIGWQVNNGAITEAQPTAPTYGLAPTTPPTRVRGSFSATFPAPGTYKLKVWTRVTTQMEANNVNDTIIATVKVLPYTPAKNVLMEVFKHQACCPCLPAAYYEDSVIKPNPKYAIANIYTPATDALVYNADGSTVNALYQLAHPAVFFDRFKFVYAYTLDRGFYNDASGYHLEELWERERYYSPVEVSVAAATFNASSRLLKVKVKAKFYDTVAGDYRFNLYLTEDSVKAWQGCATPDPYDYYHMHVVRHMAGGPWGQSGTISSPSYPGQEKSYEFTYTVPATYKTNRIEMIALVQAYNADSTKRTVLNSSKMKFGAALALGIEDAASNSKRINVYPNPATDKITIGVDGAYVNTKAEIVDVHGRLIRTITLTQEETEVNISQLASGTYMLKLMSGEKATTVELIKR